MTEGRPAGTSPASAPQDSRRSKILTVLRRFWNVTAIVSRHCAKMAWHGVSGTFAHHEAPRSQFYAREVRLGLEELGPTFVKLGQLLSSRSDLIPPSLQRELSLLRDHASTIPTYAVMAELHRSAGLPVSDVFVEFDMSPVASASVGQVHRATMADGRQVAVKIQRPGIRSEIEVDITVLAALTRLARLSRRIRRYDPIAVTDEFSRMLTAETDFATEAGNIEAVGRTFSDDSTVSIPTVVWDLSSESILVMDWIEGIPLTNADALEAAGIDRTAMARTIVHAYAKMILQSDQFHADPHPGNFIAMAGDRLGVVDFGEVGTVAAPTRAALMSLLLAVMRRDRDALADAILAICRECRPVDRAGLSQHLDELLGPIIRAELRDIKLGRVLRELLHVLRSQGLMLPADLALLVKTVIECEATADELDPTLSLSSFLGELGSAA